MRLFAHTEHPLRRRLWLAGTWTGLAVASVILTQAVWRWNDPSTKLSLGGDFVPPYAAATLIREGRAAEIYDQASMAAVERRVVRDADLEPLPIYGPYLNPPWFAMAYVPLAALPYRTAAGIWLTINLLCAAAAITLLCRMLPGPATWRNRALIPLLVLISMPFWQAVCHLQNTCLSLLLVTVIVTLWRAQPRKAGVVIAGVLCGLLFYKPQLSAVLAAVLGLSLGWRAVAGCVSTVAGLVAASAIQLPGTLTDFLHSLPGAVAAIQLRRQYNWGRQVTPRGFWRLLLQGHQGGPELPLVTLLTWAVMLAAGAFLAMCVWRSLRHRDDRLITDRLIAATIAAMPLLVPYYMDYDLLLLAVPATLLAADTLATSRAHGRIAMSAWAALSLSLYINPGLSWYSRVQLSAPLVAIVAASTMMRCAKRHDQSSAEPAPTPTLAKAA